VTRLVAACLSLALIAVVAGCGADRPADHDPALTPEAVGRAPAKQDSGRAKGGSKPRVVQLAGNGQPPVGANTKDTGPSPGAQSDAEVRAELRQARAELASFKRHLSTSAFLQTGKRAKVLSDGTAQAPENAPGVVKRVILAGNEIAKFPYKWGGGHGAWRDNGYDCSGSVSFALAAAGLLDAPMVSGAFMNWGDEGPGKWITIFANGGHIFMYVAGLRFDTSGQGRAGTRWQDAARSTTGFAVRHPPGF
jgi:cell wall-associated NlpC family hydrolase